MQISWTEYSKFPIGVIVSVNSCLPLCYPCHKLVPRVNSVSYLKTAGIGFSFVVTVYAFYIMDGSKLVLLVLCNNLYFIIKGGKKIPNTTKMLILFSYVTWHNSL